MQQQNSGGRSSCCKAGGELHQEQRGFASSGGRMFCGYIQAERRGSPALEVALR